MLDQVTTWWRLVASRAAASPDAVMLRDDLGRALTFAQYAERAKSVAAVLRDQGGFDHEAMAGRLLAGTAARILVCDIPSTPAPDTFGLPERQAAPHAADHDHDPSDVSWIYYTSGSTAAPKGIRHTDASILASCGALIDNLGMTGEDVYALPFPVTHAARSSSGLARHGRRRSAGHAGGPGGARQGARGWPPTRSPSSCRSAMRCRATRWARSSSTSSAAS